MTENQIDTEDINIKKEKVGPAIWLFAVIHMLCCGLPLLLLSGVSIIAFFENNPFVAISLAVLGLIGFVWYLKRGCATCPRNEGKCLGGSCKTDIKS